MSINRNRHHKLWLSDGQMLHKLCAYVALSLNMGPTSCKPHLSHEIPKFKSILRRECHPVVIRRKNDQITVESRAFSEK